MQASAIFHPQTRRLRGQYQVLAPLSRCYSQLQGRLPTRYSPVRHFTLPVARDFSFDLHVLGTPLAFVLSQDQTLQLNPEIRSQRTRLFFTEKSPTTRFCYLVFKEQIVMEDFYCKYGAIWLSRKKFGSLKDFFPDASICASVFLVRLIGYLIPCQLKFKTSNQSKKKKLIFING